MRTHLIDGWFSGRVWRSQRHSGGTVNRAVLAASILTLAGPVHAALDLNGEITMASGFGVGPVAIQSASGDFASLVSPTASAAYAGFFNGNVNLNTPLGGIWGGSYPDDVPMGVPLADPVTDLLVFGSSLGTISYDQFHFNLAPSSNSGTPASDQFHFDLSAITVTSFMSLPVADGFRPTVFTGTGILYDTEGIYNPMAATFVWDGLYDDIMTLTTTGAVSPANVYSTVPEPPTGIAGVAAVLILLGGLGFKAGRSRD